MWDVVQWWAWWGGVISTTLFVGGGLLDHDGNLRSDITGVGVFDALLISLLIGFSIPAPVAVFKFLFVLGDML